MFMKGYFPIMYRMSALILVSVIIITLASSYTAAQGTITGTVVDRDTQQPLPGANVFLEGTVIGAVTDRDGFFRIQNIPEERVTLVVTMVGYKKFRRPDIEIAAGESLSFTIELQSTVIETSPVVVTATKSERSLREVPTSVSVMQAEQIERQNVFSIDEVLRKIPGVHFNLSQINVRGSSGYSHGAGTRVALLVDGVPVLSGDTGEITWELIPVDHIERVEVVKGAGSTLYGSSALGGVVNIITRDLPDRSVSAVRVQGGMYDSPHYSQWRWSDRSRLKHQLQLSHGRKIGNAQVVGSLGTLYDDSYRQNDSRRRTTGYFKGSYTLSPYQTITVSSFFIDQVRDNFLYWRSFDNALEVSDGQLGEEVESFRIQSNVEYRHVFGSESFMTTRASWYYTNWNDNIGSGGNASTANVFGSEVQFNHAIASSHFLVSGLEASVQTVDSDIFGERSGYVLAAYVQDEWSIGERVNITGGVRFDATRLDTIDTFTNVSPRAGIVYEVSPYMSFRASAGAGFRAPTSAEAFATTAVSGLIVEPNPDLDAERSWSYEIGFNAQAGNWMNIDAAVFQNDFWDMIEPEANVDFDGGLTARFVNLVRARVRGAEAGITFSLFDRMLQPSIGYTFVDGRDIDSDEPLKYRHKHMLVTGLLARIAGGWIEVDYRYLSEVENVDRELGFIIDRHDEHVPVHIVDVSAGSEMMLGGIPVRISASVKNLLQYHYVEFVANVQPIRQFLATVQVVM